jgi:hypothetical protein
MSNLVRCGVFAIVCLLPLGAWSQNTERDAVKAGDSAKAAELALKVDSAATKGATGAAGAAPPNKTAPESQGAGNGADAAVPANKMNSDGASGK